MGFANVKRYSSKLNSLKSAKKKEREEIIRCASDTFIKVLCECCLNVLNGVVELTPNEKRTLTKYREIIRTLGKSKLAIKSRKKILFQKGGFIPTLVTSVLKLT